MDSLQENIAERRDAIRREYDAKAERLSAEARMEYNDAFDDLQTEMDATGDYSEATLKEYAAKADKIWQEFVIKMQTN